MCIPWRRLFITQRDSSLKGGKVEGIEETRMELQWVDRSSFWEGKDEGVVDERWEPRL